MSLCASINFNSLRIVSEELNLTIKQAATEFEAYLADPTERSYLDSSYEHIAQIAGVFRLMQYPGSLALAEEMQALLAYIQQLEKPSEPAFNALTHAFFVLPHYLEFISTRHYEMPILMTTYINEMRITRKAGLLSDHVFYPEMAQSCSAVSLPVGIGAQQLSELQTLAPRLRHMYQVGLLGVIKDQSSILHFQLMHRAMSRASRLLGEHTNSGLWRLATVFLGCFAENRLELNVHRKRYLASIEKLLRNFVTKGDDALNGPVDAELQQDLLFCLLLAGNEAAEATSFLAELGLKVSSDTDKDVIQQREVMHGPSLETFDSVINVLKEELRTAKEILEISSQHKAIEEDDLQSLKEVMSRVADTLMLLNLTGPQEMLREQLALLESTSADSQPDFMAAADVILFVDSSLTSLKRHEFSTEELNQVTEIGRREIVANNQLSEAEQVVIEEAKSCISLAKRAITSYVDSNFEVAHIANVSTTLNTVRGSLYILGYKRSAAVVKSCSAFIEDHINQLGVGGHRHQLLETLADALISIEYYLNEIDVNREPNEMILEIAEESLKALGFAVENA